MSLNSHSLSLLEGCHPALRELAARVNKQAGVQIIQGHRSNAAQQVAYATGKSKAKPGQSPHNAWPSRAWDFLPQEFHVPADWNNIAIFRGTAHIIIGISWQSGIPVRWGGDWDRDGDEADEKGLRDFDHIELYPWRTYGGVAAVFK